MPFNASQGDKIKEHIGQFQMTCPVCGRGEFGIYNDPVFMGILDAEYKTPVQGKVYPLVIAVCSECGYVASFSATSIGV